MMQSNKRERAVFISRNSAHFALIKEGRKRGLPDTMIAGRGRTFPVHRRGQMIGWEAWIPAHIDATHNVPILEEA
jgi:hypothetical protein